MIIKTIAFLKPGLPPSKKLSFYDVINWETNNYNTHLVSENETWLVNPISADGGRGKNALPL